MVSPLRAPLALLATACLLAGCQGSDSGALVPDRGGDDPPSTSSGRTPSSTDLARLEAWTIEDPRVDESSGLAWGRVHPDVVYTHNDRGSGPELFVVDDDGTLAVLRMDALALDWEDVATTPDGRIWVGDIGDNDQARGTVEVAVVEEPEVLVSADVPTTSYELSYPDGPHDAEALLVDPRDDRIHIVTKDAGGGQVFRAPEQLVADEVNELERVTGSPAGITAGDIAPDGQTVVLRTQSRAFFYSELGGTATVVRLPKQPQGESVAFTPDGTHVLVGSEGVESQVLLVPVPGLEE